MNKEYKYRAIIYDRKKDIDRVEMDELLSEKSPELLDTIEGQIRELIKIRNIGIRLTEDQGAAKRKEILGEQDSYDFGSWVYYPWKNTIVHILGEQDFVEVRTSRNLYKISPKELAILKTKKVGVVGLSVGSAIAITMAQERIFSEIRLADFDELELSNCNRIKTSITNLGLPKVVITAREILEIDPYLKVVCYEEGLNSKNIDGFINEPSKLDLLLDECDDIGLKVSIRQHAKALGVPVVMDTSDRGLIDIERYDLAPDRPIFHGLLNDYDLSEIDHLKTAEEKLKFIVPILGIDNLSVRGKASMLEINQTIGTWPQLASSIALGAGVTTDVSRKILTGSLTTSGRFYVDVDDLIADPVEEETQELDVEEVQPLQVDTIEAHAKKYLNKIGAGPELSYEVVKEVVEAGILAPTSGNNQPWRWHYEGGVLFLFHDAYYSMSFGDYQDMATMIGLGGAIENVILAAQAKGYEVVYDCFPVVESPFLTAVFKFKKEKAGLGEVFEAGEYKHLAEFIPKRYTNRGNEGYHNIDQDKVKQLSEIVESSGRAKLDFVFDQEVMHEIGDIIAECDRIRLFNEQCYLNFCEKEIRWTSEELKEVGWGNDFKSLQLDAGDTIALNLVRDKRVIDYIKELDLGRGIKSVTHKTVNSASALGFLTVPEYSQSEFLNGGRIAQRLWLKATELNIAFQPIIAPLYFFPRLIHGKGEGLNSNEIEQLAALRKRFLKVFPYLDDKMGEVYLFRINIAAEPKFKSVRRPLSEVFTSTN